MKINVNALTKLTSDKVEKITIDFKTIEDKRFFGPIFELCTEAQSKDKDFNMDSIKGNVEFYIGHLHSNRKMEIFFRSQLVGQLATLATCLFLYGCDKDGKELFADMELEQFLILSDNWNASDIGTLAKPIVDRLVEVREAAFPSNGESKGKK